MGNFYLIPNAFKGIRGIDEDKANPVSDARNDVDVTVSQIAQYSASTHSLG